MHEETHGLYVVEGGADIDAHERAHANDISRRFQDRNVTTPQIILFGPTGGLIPCPAAIAVLLLCLQLKQFVLGVVLVAVTMVAVGVVASLGVKQVQKRWSGFSSFARRAPYASGALMLLIAVYMVISG
jgi:nickel/cobalt exporter